MDLRNVMRNIKRARCRRAGPPWAIPNELWRLVLCCPLVSQPPRAGIGSPKTFSKLKWFRFLVLQILVKIKHTKQTPLSWHRSCGFSLFKKNLPNAKSCLIPNEPYMRSTHLARLTSEEFGTRPIPFTPNPLCGSMGTFLAEGEKLRLSNS